MNDSLHVYIDESGDLGKHGSKHFTVCAIAVKNPVFLKRIIKKTRQRKLKKKVKQLPELKANNCDKLTREFVLRKIGKTDCSIVAIVVKKDNTMNHLFAVKNKLYNYLCGTLLDQLWLPSYKLSIIIDKKHTNTLLREDFNVYIKNKILSKNKHLNIELAHQESFSSNELQVADFVAWSINRKFNALDDSYFLLIEHKIINKNSLVL